MKPNGLYRPLAAIGRRFRRFQTWLTQPFERHSKLDGEVDVPDYLREDIGLPPNYHRKARQSGDPPVPDPFRLL